MVKTTLFNILSGKEKYDKGTIENVITNLDNAYSELTPNGVNIVENANKYVSIRTRWLQRAHQGYSYGPLFFKYYLHVPCGLYDSYPLYVRMLLVVLKHELDVSWV